MQYPSDDQTRQEPEQISDVAIFPVTQATTAVFTGLYFRLTFLFFIHSGSKRVLCPVNGEIIGEVGDLMIFPPGVVETMQNRPIPNSSYHADGVCFSHDMVDAVFADQPVRGSAPGIQIIRGGAHQPHQILQLIKETVGRNDLPLSIKHHRLLEPLIWLRENGVRRPIGQKETPWSKVRDLIETDVSRSWRIDEVAKNFAMSEATFRRWLTKSGAGFSQILLNTRLERGLTLLQTTDRPISQIALDCGFKTPSHFSDVFRKRFGIMPKLIRTIEE